jgi:hypothetical protein
MGGDVIGNYPVILFWHTPVKGPKTGFDMVHRDVKFYCGKGTDHNRICIPLHLHDIGGFFFHDLFDNLQNFSGLFTIRPEPHIEVILRSWQL